MNLNALIQTQIRHLSQKTNALQASIHAACSADIYIQADSFLLGQAIVNLLENALDFSPQPNNKVQSAIAVTVTEENNQIQIAI